MSAPHGPNELPPPAVMMQMLSGRWLSQAISCVADLGIADALKDAEKSPGELAKTLGLHEDSLARLLRSLTAFGVFDESSPGLFALTPVGQTLRADSPDSLRGMARFMGQELMVRSWANLAFSVRTGKPAFDEVVGMPPFEYAAKNPEMAAIFNEAMTSLSRPEAGAIAAGYDFTGITTLCDVGGGHGWLLSEILKANASMKGILFELPHALDGARKTFKEAGQLARVEVVAGDFFAGVPPPADAIIMKHILHDWDDASSVSILKNCARSLKPGGKLLVAEMVPPSAPVPHPAKLLDLEMLAVTKGGRERTEDEFAKLLTQAGFRLSRVVPTHSAVSILEGVRA